MQEENVIKMPLKLYRENVWCPEDKVQMLTQTSGAALLSRDCE